VNPTPAEATFEGLGDGIFAKINGIQDPQHNDGIVVNDTLTVPPFDGYVLHRLEDRR
jgi:hypothetical protein